jgi:hypothetical protein
VVLEGIVSKLVGGAVAGRGLWLCFDSGFDYLMIQYLGME